MMIPTGPLYLAAAILPVLFLLIMILKFGWGVAKAAPFGMMIAGVIALVLFRSSPLALFLEAGKGAWNAATILLVIWPALFSYELTDQAHGFQAIRQGIQSLTRHELLQILILGWIFPSFLQGITGFGVAVAVGAPLLLSIGVKPLYSIVIVLLCHVWGATFGTLALAWSALVAQAGMTDVQNAQAAIFAAAMIWLLNLVCVLLSCWMYGKGKALKEALPAVLPLSLILGGGELLLAPINATVSCFLPSAVGLAAVLLLSRTKKYQQPWSLADSPVMERTAQQTADTSTCLMNFHQAFLPYYALTVITVVCLLIPPINAMLSQWKLGFAFPETSTGYGFVTAADPFFSPLKPLTYAGTFLALSSLLSFFYYQKKGFVQTADLKEVWAHTVKKCTPSTIAILTLIIMSKFMSSSGMIYVLSQSAVSLFGRFYVVAAPFFGMLGAFITSSNMSSNILLGSFQRTAADLLGIDPIITVALQTVGGILGNAFAPGCVIMGLSTTGYTGKDSDILKKIIPVSATLGIIFGLFAFLVSL